MCQNCNHEISYPNFSAIAVCKTCQTKYLKLLNPKLPFALLIVSILLMAIAKSFQYHISIVTILVCLYLFIGFLVFCCGTIFEKLPFSKKMMILRKINQHKDGEKQMSIIFFLISCLLIFIFDFILVCLAIHDPHGLILATITILYFGCFYLVYQYRFDIFVQMKLGYYVEKDK